MSAVDRHWCSLLQRWGEPSPAKAASPWGGKGETWSWPRRLRPPACGSNLQAGGAAGRFRSLPPARSQGPTDTAVPGGGSSLAQDAAQGGGGGGGAAPQPFHPHHPLGVWQLPPAAMQPPTPRARSRSRSRPLPGAAPTREPGQGEPSVAGDGCHRLGVWRRRSSAAHSRHSAPLQSPPVCKQPRLWPSMSLFFPRASPLARAPGCPPGPGWRLPPLRFWITFAGGSVAGVHAAARELLGRTSGPREPAPIPRLGSGSANCH